MRFSFIPFLLLVIPIAEISVFVLVGQQIGLLPVLSIIFSTAVLGSVLLRVQGMGILRKLAEETEAGRVPTRELVHGAMIVVAGILLITPGFVTDTIGFLLFVPQFRDAAWAFLKNKISFVTLNSGFGGQGRSGPQPKNQGGDHVVDLDPADFNRDPNPDSPWNEGDKDR